MNLCGVVHRNLRIGATGLNGLRCHYQYLCGSFPVSVTLECFNLGKIQAVENKPGRVQPAEFFPHFLVDQAVLGLG